MAGHKADNGFEALKALDDYSSNSINDRDPAYSRLLVWTDRNHNGLSEPDELQSAASAGLVSIGTDYKLSRRVDRHGNEFRQKGKATFVDGVSDSVWDVWLVGTLTDSDDDAQTP